MNSAVGLGNPGRLIAVFPDLGMLEKKVNPEIGTVPALWLICAGAHHVVEIAHSPLTTKPA